MRIILPFKSGPTKLLWFLLCLGHVLFAIFYSTSHFLCKSTFYHLMNAGGLLIKVLPDRKNEGVKQKQ